MTRAGRALGTVVVALVVLAGCRGGGDGATPATSAPSNSTSSNSTSRPDAPSPSSGPTTSSPASSSPATGTERGAILASEPLDAGGVGGTVWRVRYRSESLVGSPIEVSGLLAVPDGQPPAGGWPVLAWAHGTTGVADRCAPSALGVRGVPFLAEHLAAGFVVAATDYEGLGTPGVHPYLVLGSEGRSVLDSVRAASALLGSDVGTEVAVVGHSQGGHAALAAAELVVGETPELTLVGTVALAPAADLELIIPALFSSTVGFTLGSYVAAGWPAAHPDLSAADLLSDAGLAIVEQVERDVCTFDLGSLLGGAGIDDLVTTRPNEQADWAARIDENTIHVERVHGPVLVAQGGADPLVPPVLTKQLVERLCAAGSATTYLVDDDADHGTIVGRSVPAVHDWLAARFRGEPAGDTCEGG